MTLDQLIAELLDTRDKHGGMLMVVAFDGDDSFDNPVVGVSVGYDNGHAADVALVDMMQLADPEEVTS